MPSLPPIPPIVASASARPAAAPLEPAPPPPPARRPVWALNPDPRIDPGLNLLVLEFHDATGRVTRTIPSAQQLESYRLHGVPGRDRPSGS